MALDFKALDMLMSEIQSKLMREMILANRMGQLDKVVKKYGLDFSEKYYYSDTSRSPKVLICGDLSINKNDIFGIIKGLQMNPGQFEFVSYDEIANFNFKKLEFNSGYSDILWGPVPHSATNKGEYSSIITQVEDNNEKYPRSNRLQTYEGSLKATKTSLLNGLMKTRLYELCKSRSA